jgi:hypothetical protein
MHRVHAGGISQIEGVPSMCTDLQRYAENAADRCKAEDPRMSTCDEVGCTARASVIEVFENDRKTVSCLEHAGVSDDPALEEYVRIIDRRVRGYGGAARTHLSGSAVDDDGDISRDEQGTSAPSRYTSADAVEHAGGSAEER